MTEIFIHESARKFLDSLEKKVQLNIKEHLKKLATNPYSNTLDIKKLKGVRQKKDLFRLRVGNYRIIYSIENENILITEIRLRERGYDF